MEIRIDMNASKDNTIESKSFIKKLFGFSIPSFICAFITFAASFINTRLYDTATMGKINLFFTAQNFVLFFAYFGLDQSYCRYYYETSDDEQKSRLYNICFSVSLYVSIAISVVILTFWKFISNYIVGEHSILVAFSLVISVFAQVIWRYLSLLERMRHRILLYTILMVLNSLTNKLSFTTISWLSNDVNLCISIIAISSLVVTIVFYVLESGRSRMVAVKTLRDDEMARRALKFGVPLMPVSLISWLNSSIPVLLLRSFTDYDTVGIYSNTVVLVGIISLIQSGFNTFWVPYYYQNYKSSQSKIMKVHNVICYIMVAFAILLVIFKDLIFYILGNDYRPGATAFSLLLVSPVCYTIGETTGIGIGISEKSYLNSIVYLFGALSTFILSFIFIPPYSVRGAGVAVAISAILTLAIKTVIGEKYYRTVQYKHKTILAIVFIVLACLIDVYVVANIIRILLLIFVLLVLSVLYWNEIKYCFDIIIRIVKPLVSRFNKVKS